MKFNSIKETLGKAYRKYYFCIIPLLILIVCLGIRAVNFSRNDDTFMQKFALSFSTNQHSEQLMYMSVIAGYLLRFLYLLIPAINWFVILYLSALTISMIVFYKILSSYDSIVKNVLISIVFLYSLMYITFTVVAFITCAAGFILFIDKVNKLSLKNIGYIIASWLLIILGFSIRGGQTFLFITLVFVPIYIWRILSKQNSAIAIALLLIICTLSSYSISFTNNQYNAKIPQETYYNEFQEYRSAVTDEGNVHYEGNEEYFNNLGITENDVKMATSFFYGSKKVFNKESLKSMADARSTADIYEINPIHLMKYLMANTNNLLFLCIFIFILICFILLSENNRIIALSASLMDLAAIGYLFLKKRPVERVVVSVILVGILILLLISKSTKFDISRLKILEGLKKNKKLVIIALLCLCIPFTYLGYSYSNALYSTEKDEIIDSYIREQDDNNLYVSFVGHCGYRFDAYRLALLTKNVYDSPIEQEIIGDTGIYTYYWYDKLEQYNLQKYTDEILLCLLDDNVYYVCTGEPENNEKLEIFVTFFKEHYAKNVQYNLIKDFDNDNIGIYKFSETT